MKRTFFIAVAVLIAAGMVHGQSMELTSARLYKKQGELQKSLGFYNSALEKDPNLLMAYYERGELYNDIASDSNLADLAREIAGEGDFPQRILYERMIADFQQATTERDPKDQSTIRKLEKKIDRILQDRWNHSYFVAVQCDSLYDQATAAGAVDSVAKTYLQDGVTELDLAIKFHPEKWNAYGLRAQLLGKLKHQEEALISWAEALKYIEASKMKKEQPEEYETAAQVIRLNLLQGNYNLNRFRETIELADQILAKDSTNMDALRFKAFAIAQLATDESIAKEERDALKSQAVSALEVATDSTMIIKQYIAQYADTAAAQAAFQVYRTPLLYSIGQFNLQLADTAAALAAFQEFLTFEEKDRDALFVLGVIYLEGGTFTNTEKARDIFAKIKEYFPEDVPAWTNYGIALIRLGQTNEGKKAIEKAKSLQK